MPAHKIPLATRLAAGWTLDPKTGCHVWHRNKTQGGYGMISERKKGLLSHRVAYELAHGPIPDGYEIDHLCFNASCVNPAHLEAVTKQENMRRTRPASKGFCKRGHPFDDENTLLIGNQRRCRACSRLRAAAHYWGNETPLKELEAELFKERALRMDAEAEAARLWGELARHGVVFHDSERSAA